MSSKHNRRLRIAFVALAVAVSGLAVSGPAAAAAQQPTARAAATSTAIPVDFVDLPTSPLAADARSHTVQIAYRNDSGAVRTVAPQLLVESPDGGPFLAPSDIKVERRTATGCWETVRLATQTGTLFTDLSTGRRTLSGGETLTEAYRITVTNPEARGTVHPRVALY